MSSSWFSRSYLLLVKNILGRQPKLPLLGTAPHSCSQCSINCLEGVLGRGLTPHSITPTDRLNCPHAVLNLGLPPETQSSKFAPTKGTFPITCTLASSLASRISLMTTDYIDLSFSHLTARLVELILCLYSSSWEMWDLAGFRALQDKWRSWNSKPRPRDFLMYQVVPRNPLATRGDAGPALVRYLRSYADSNQSLRANEGTLYATAKTWHTKYNQTKAPLLFTKFKPCPFKIAVLPSKVEYWSTPQITSLQLDFC